MRSPNGELFKIDGTTTQEAKASGIYKRMPTRAELLAQAATTAPAAPAPAAPAAPAPAPAPAPPPPAPPASGGKKGMLGKIVVGGLSVIGALALVVIFWPGGEDGAGVAGAGSDSMAVRFILDSAGDHPRGLAGFARDDDGSCGWTELNIDGIALVRGIGYTQVADSAGWVHLVAKGVTLDSVTGEHVIHAFLPRDGGYVESIVDDTGQRVEEFDDSHVRGVMVKDAAAAKGLPKCERPVK
jgi:hypothetical protein